MDYVLAGAHRLPDLARAARRASFPGAANMRFAAAFTGDRIARQAHPVRTPHRMRQS